MVLLFFASNNFAININILKPLCSTTSDYTLKAAPPISEEYTAIASKITTAFLGDPSFFAYNGEEADAEPEVPEAKTVERFREGHRLTYTIQVQLFIINSLCNF